MLEDDSRAPIGFPLTSTRGFDREMPRTNTGKVFPGHLEIGSFLLREMGVSALQGFIFQSRRAPDR